MITRSLPGRPVAALLLTLTLLLTALITPQRAALADHGPRATASAKAASVQQEQSALMRREPFRFGERFNDHNDRRGRGGDDDRDDDDDDYLITSLNLFSIGASSITARITIRDEGDKLIIDGTGTGFNFGNGGSNAYATLLYDINSVATGPQACVPTNAPVGPPNLQQMLAGFWKVQPNGRAKLHAELRRKEKAYVSVYQIGTVSVRLINGPFGPAGFPLQACGKVGRIRYIDDDRY